MTVMTAIRGKLRLRTRLRHVLAPLLADPAAPPLAQAPVPAPPPEPLIIHALPPPSQETGLRDSVLRGWFNQETHELYTGFPVGPDDVVADIGCGLGGHAGFCSRQGARVILVDADPARMEKAVARIEAIPDHPPYESLVTQSNPLPIADGAATRIICSEVLEHVDDPAVMMAEMARIGRPGALYLLTCPDPAAEELQKRLAPESYFQKPNHIRVIARDEFAKLVEGAGLQVVSRSSFGFFWSIWVSLFWGSGVELDEAAANSFQIPGHPVLDHWLRTWQALLDQPEGLKVKNALDDLMPKSQLIIARKP